MLKKVNSKIYTILKLSHSDKITQQSIKLLNISSISNKQTSSYTTQSRRLSTTNSNGPKPYNSTIEMDINDIKKRLTPLQFRVTQQADTEKPFTGVYDKHFEKGEYLCIVCEQKLFNSEQKFNSGCGWPAFSRALEGGIKENKDVSHGMVRTEVVCKKCGAHLGHVFDDGPEPTGIRYCINSASLNFKNN